MDTLHMVSRLHMAIHNTRDGPHRAAITDIHLLPVGTATTANIVTAIRQHLLCQLMAPPIPAMRPPRLQAIPAIRLWCPLPMRVILLRLLQGLFLQTLPVFTPRRRSTISSSGESAISTRGSYWRITYTTLPMPTRSPKTRELNRNSFVLESFFLPLPVRLLNSLHLKSPLWLKSLPRIPKSPLWLRVF
jgi:hypothetical protein